MEIKAEWVELVAGLPDKLGNSIGVEAAEEILEVVSPLIAQEAIEKAGLQFNPDYLDFQKGVEAGKIVERERIKEGGNEDCPHNPNPIRLKVKRGCIACWQSLVSGEEQK